MTAVRRHGFSTFQETSGSGWSTNVLLSSSRPLLLEESPLTPLLPLSRWERGTGGEGLGLSAQQRNYLRSITPPESTSLPSQGRAREGSSRQVRLLLCFSMATSPPPSHSFRRAGFPSPKRRGDECPWMGEAIVYLSCACSPAITLTGTSDRPLLRNCTYFVWVDPCTTNRSPLRGSHDL